MTPRFDAVLYTALWIIYAPLWVYYVRAFYVARRKQPIVVRTPLLVVAVDVALAVWLTFSVTQFYWLAPCAVVLLFVGSLVAVILATSLVRLWCVCSLQQLVKRALRPQHVASVSMFCHGPCDTKRG